MFKKDKTEETQPAEAPKAKEEAAYEDSWYRSLKAMAERDEDQDEQVGVPED
jgi:hypothetical protein